MDVDAVFAVLGHPLRWELLRWMAHQQRAVSFIEIEAYLAGCQHIVYRSGSLRYHMDRLFSVGLIALNHKFGPGVHYWTTPLGQTVYQAAGMIAAKAEEEFQTPIL